MFKTNGTRFLHNGYRCAQEKRYNVKGNYFTTTNDSLFSTRESSRVVFVHGQTGKHTPELPAEEIAAALGGKNPFLYIYICSTS